MGRKEILKNHQYKNMILKVGIRRSVYLITLFFLIASCSSFKPDTLHSTSIPSSTTVPSITYTPSTSTNSPVPQNTYYVDNKLGADLNPGTISKPWQTIEQAVSKVKAGDLILLRAGEYSTIEGGWVFQNSGTQANPITVSNYPGDQAVINISNADKSYGAFGCWYAPSDPANWQTPKAEYIRIIGSDVTPRILSNGVFSQKGIVIQGVLGRAAGIEAAGCDHWEVAGIDFVDVAFSIFQKKRNFSSLSDGSADGWYVHDNRVYRYWNDSGMQFNGNQNLIENNEIYKVTNINDTPYGCQAIDLLGNNNIVRHNVFSLSGSAAGCLGILFEWDLSDKNLIEQNTIIDGSQGISISGGDQNTIQNNLIYMTENPDPHRGGITINSYNAVTDWPCNETAEAPEIVPPDDPSHPDYQYYYNPRDCHSYGNRIFNNVIHGYAESIRFFPLVGETTVIRNNVLSGWTRGSICYLIASLGICSPLPSSIVMDHNAVQGPFGFVDLQGFDFHLTATSPLIDAGYDVPITNDFEDRPRPQGTAYDIGPFEIDPAK